MVTSCACSPVHAATCRAQNGTQSCVNPAGPQLIDNAFQSMYSQCMVSVQTQWSDAVFLNRCRWHVLWSTSLLRRGRLLCVPRTSQAFHPGSLSRPVLPGCCSRRSPHFHNRSAAHCQHPHCIVIALCTCC